MIGWHDQLNGHQFELTLGDGERQRSLACCNTWGCKESDTTELLNNNNKRMKRQAINWRVCISSSVISDSLPPHGLCPARLLCSWNAPCKNTGVGCHSLLQGIFPIQGSNSGLLHCKWILYHLSHHKLEKISANHISNEQFVSGTYTIKI